MPQQLPWTWTQKAKCRARELTIQPRWTRKTRSPHGLARILPYRVQTRTFWALHQGRRSRAHIQRTRPKTHQGYTTRQHHQGYCLHMRPTRWWPPTHLPSHSSGSSRPTRQSSTTWEPLPGLQLTCSHRLLPPEMMTSLWMLFTNYHLNRPPRNALPDRVHT